MVLTGPYPRWLERQNSNGDPVFSHRNGLGLSGILWIPPFVWIRRGFDRKQRAVFEDTVNLNLGTEENARNIPIGPALSPKEKEDLTRCLLDYKEFCAWSYEDMPGLYSDLVEHRLPPETSPSSKSFGGYTLIWTSKLERRFHKKKQQIE
jgi:hypothetical protein